MTAPVSGPDDVVAGCVQYLRTLPALAAALGADSGGLPLVVQDAAPDRSEFAAGVCLVIAYAGPAAGNEHNTYEQVRLLAEFWAEPDRDPDGYAVEPAAGRRRMVAAYHALDRALHRPQGGAQDWAGVRTIDCTRLAGLTPYPVPDSDYLWRGTAYYGVGLG